jgi:hypothetical protein
MTEYLDKWDGDIIRALRFQDEQICELAADEIERLRAALIAWMDAVRIDATMEGPVYMGISSTLGRKAWEQTRAALAQGGE